MHKQTKPISKRIGGECLHLHKFARAPVENKLGPLVRPRSIAEIHRDRHLVFCRTWQDCLQTVPPDGLLFSTHEDLVEAERPSFDEVSWMRFFLPPFLLLDVSRCGDRAARDAVE